MQTAAETACAITVAPATPATPSSKMSTLRRSSATLSREQKMRKISGVLLSPSARSTEAAAL